MITVALVEDDQKIRMGLLDFLAGDTNCCCVGAFGSAEEAEPQLLSLTPKVVVVDINLPGMDGVTLIQRISPLLPQTQFLMLTVLSDTQAIFNALTGGAHGYLLKPIRAKQFLAAIHDVYGGGAPMSSSIARRVVQLFQQHPPTIQKAKTEEEEYQLSSREKEVLELLSHGLLYKEISDQLCVEYRTVTTYVERIYRKLHVHSRSQAIAKYMTDNR
jgi:DNA-binding NarL/FixJ family response regulator